MTVYAAQIAKDREQLIDAQTAVAETFAKQAQASNSFILAAHWMQKAVEAYKNIPDSKVRKEELYKELLSFQHNSLKELTEIKTTVDVSECIDLTVKAIEGKPLREALIIFLFRLVRIPNYREFEKAVNLARKDPLSAFFGVDHLDGEGKLTARSPSNVAQAESTSAYELYSFAALSHQYQVTGCIIPASEVIRNEHFLSLADFESLAFNNPFVAEGQERMWAQGLYAGFKRDFEVSLPIITPLLENSIRYTLKKAGVRVSTFNTHGVQEELRINALLNHEMALEIFGYDVIMDLKGLLVERTYANLRNVISHGICSIEVLYSPPAIYLWWLCFRLFLSPYAIQLSKIENSSYKA